MFVFSHSSLSPRCIAQFTLILFQAKGLACSFQPSGVSSPRPTTATQWQAPLARAVAARPSPAKSRWPIQDLRPQPATRPATVSLPDSSRVCSDAVRCSVQLGQQHAGQRTLRTPGATVGEEGGKGEVTSCPSRRDPHSANQVTKHGIACGPTLAPSFHNMCRVVSVNFILI